MKREYLYDFHLFTQLTLLRDSALNELEYDYQFAELINLYEEFEQYDINSRIGVYESINNFLNTKYND